jgi:hypothetical protein
MLQLNKIYKPDDRQKRPFQVEMNDCEIYHSNGENRKNSRDYLQGG